MGFEFEHFFSAWTPLAGTAVPPSRTISLSVSDSFAGVPLPLQSTCRMRFLEGGALLNTLDASGNLSLSGYSCQLFDSAPGASGFPIYTPAIMPPQLSVFPSLADAVQQLSLPGGVAFRVGDVFATNGGVLVSPSLSFYAYIANSDAVNAHSISLGVWWRVLLDV